MVSRLHRRSIICVLLTKLQGEVYISFSLFGETMKRKSKQTKERYDQTEVFDSLHKPFGLICAPQSNTDANNKQKNKKESLQQCEVCGCNKALYVCPGCEMKSCSAVCVKQHKTDTGCEGKRKRTEFIPKEKMNERDLRSDLTFLSEGLQEVDRSKRVATCTEEERPISKTGQKIQKRLVSEAKKRNCSLLLMPATMSKHLRNNSRFDAKSSKILWRVEWIVDSTVKHVSKLVDENEIIRNIIPQFIEGKSMSTSIIKLEVRNSEPVDVSLDITLREGLDGKTIVEFPTFHATLELEESK